MLIIMCLSWWGYGVTERLLCALRYVRTSSRFIPSISNKKEGKNKKIARNIVDLFYLSSDIAYLRFISPRLFSCTACRIFTPISPWHQSRQHELPTFSFSNLFFVHSSCQGQTERGASSDNVTLVLTISSHMFGLRIIACNRMPLGEKKCDNAPNRRCAGSIVNGRPAHCVNVNKIETIIISVETISVEERKSLELEMA